MIVAVVIVFSRANSSLSVWAISNLSRNLLWVEARTRTLPLAAYARQCVRCPANRLPGPENDGRDKKTKYGLFYLQKLIFVSMDTNFLKTFLVVVEHGSLAEAARRQGLTRRPRFGVRVRCRAYSAHLRRRVCARNSWESAFIPAV